MVQGLEVEGGRLKVERFFNAVHGKLPLLMHVNWDHEPTPSPLNGERARVRGENAESFEFPKVRFMERLDLRTFGRALDP